MPEPDEEFFFIEDGRAWLGVTLSDINADKARELKLSGEYGALVEDVSEESPAVKAGLQKGDVIVGFGGERVRSVAHLTRLVRETPAGRKVNLEVVRSGQSRTLEATLAARQMHFMQPEIAVAPRVHVGPMSQFKVEVPPLPGVMAWTRGPRLGITADEIDGQLAEYFGIKQGHGVLVREVMEGSAAAKAGLKAGDVIVRINDTAVNDVGDLREALNELENKEATVTFVRDRREQTVKVTLDEPLPRERRRAGWVDETRWNEWQHRYQEEMQRVQERMAEVQEKIQQQLQSREYQEQMRQLQEQLQRREQEIEQKLNSDQFQQQMRELERRLQEVQIQQKVI